MTLALDQPGIAPVAGLAVASPPRSSTGALTGLAGLAAALGAIWLLQHWLQPGWLKALVVAATVAAAMIAVELGFYRSHLNASTGLMVAPVRRLDLARVGRKLAGFWATMSSVGAFYLVLPEYAGAFYEPFRAAALWCLPGLVVISPLYISWVDRRQVEPDDAYAQLGALLGGRRPQSWAPLLAHGRAWVVKGFFLPLMFVFLANSLRSVWAIEALPPLDRFDLYFEHLMDLFYLIDVLIAVIGYGLTLRVLDTQVRSTEPTVAGWVVCLVCYPPFWTSLLTPYFAYERDGLRWGTVFDQWPVLYLAWGGAILLLVGIYAWATVAFGLRFSNLTNRGIITNGPYRWTKHPAYICKCLSFWMISVPFVPGAGWLVAVQSCLLLLGCNLLYVLRARTEERHLLADPAYREYHAFMAEHGLFAPAARALRRLRFSA